MHVVRSSHWRSVVSVAEPGTSHCTAVHVVKGVQTRSWKLPAGVDCHSEPGTHVVCEWQTRSDVVVARWRKALPFSAGTSRQLRADAVAVSACRPRHPLRTGAYCVRLADTVRCHSLRLSFPFVISARRHCSALSIGRWRCRLALPVPRRTCRVRGARAVTIPQSVLRLVLGS